MKARFTALLIALAIALTFSACTVSKAAESVSDTLSETADCPTAWSLQSGWTALPQAHRWRMNFSILPTDILSYPTIRYMCPITSYLYPLKPAKGVTLSQESGVHEIYLTENEYMKKYYDFTADGKLKGIPIILELDGQLYRVVEVNGEPPISGIDIERTRVISRNKYELKFACNLPVPKEDSTVAVKTSLINSEDGWRCSQIDTVW